MRALVENQTGKTSVQWRTLGAILRGSRHPSFILQKVIVFLITRCLSVLAEVFGSFSHTS